MNRVALEDAGVNDPTLEASARNKEIDYSEIMAVRELIRSSNYLHAPEITKPLTNLDGSLALNDELEEFTTKARQRQQAYLSMYGTGLEVTPDPIYVTSKEKDESRRLNKLTKVQLQERIMTVLDKMDEARKLLLHDRFLKSVKKGNKDTYIGFLQEVESSLETHETVTEVNPPVREASNE